MQFDLHAGANLQLAPQRINGPVDEILGDRLPRQRFIAVNRQRNSGLPRRPQPQFVMQGDGLKNGAELVIAVGALAENVQPQIDFRERWDADFAHAAY